MADTRTQQQWLDHLDHTATAVANAADLETVRQALTLAWHTTAAVQHSATPAAERDWMHLAEAVFTASGDLHHLDNLPEPSGFSDLPPGTGMLPDSPQLRQRVARLLRNAAAALRGIAANIDVRDADAALTMSAVAAALDGAVQGWP